MQRDQFTAKPEKERQVHKMKRVKKFWLKYEIKTARYVYRHTHTPQSRMRKIKIL